jgi:hypothetical protein
MWEEIEGELGENFDIFLSQLRTVLVKDKARLNLLREFEDNIYEPKSPSGEFCLMSRALRFDAS